MTAILLFLAGASLAAAAEGPSLPGYVAKVAVSAEGRLDWTFVLSHQSHDTPPEKWTAGYRSTDQHYELYVPPDYSKDKSYPLVLFISAKANPAGWEQWRAVCVERKAIFASPYDAGNECEFPRRVHIVLDVLDDIRRKYRVDTDRTYLGGISGGGRATCSIAYALPEYFGGIVPMCAAEEWREERCLWHRLIARLSVALVTGETDFNRAEVERYRFPMLEAMKVRSKLWVVPGLGHGIADSAALREIYDWLETGLPQRRELAKRWPAACCPSDPPWDRIQWSELLLAEAKERLEQPERMFSGLMQLKGAMNRWPDLPAGKEAEKMLREYSQRQERPWAKADIEEKSRYRVADARGAASFALGPLMPPYDKMRGRMATAALHRWEEILKLRPSGALREEAERLIADLKKVAGPEEGK